MQTIKKLILLSATPITVFYPLPAVPFLIFSLSQSQLDLFIFLKIVVISFLFSATINLWNHLNDVLEDSIARKDNLFLTDRNLRNFVAVLIPVFYVFSFILIYNWVVDPLSIFLFPIVIFFTWAYSDTFLLGRYFRRFKEDYKTEVLTYVISYPLFSITLWTLSSKINTTAIMVSVLLTLFGLWGVTLKDIKDLTSDKLAGYNTLAVRFQPKTLLKISFLFIFLYYILLLPMSIQGLIKSASLIIIIMILFPIYTLHKLIKENWSFNENLIRPLNLMASSNVISIFLIGLVNLF